MVLIFSVVNKRNFVLHEIFVHVIKFTLTRLFSVLGHVVFARTVRLFPSIMVAYPPLIQW
jgi:hypothetical protein